MYRTGILCAILIVVSIALKAQPGDSIRIRTQSVTAMGKLADDYADRLDRKMERYLHRLQKQEEKLQRKLAKLDSAQAAALFNGTKEKYEALHKSLKQKTDNLANIAAPYIPRLDSMGTLLKFLEGNNGYLANLAKGAAPIKDALEKAGGLQSKLQSADRIKQYIKERKALLQQALDKYGLGKQLKKFSKEGYYAITQINEYKQALHDPKKLEQKALELLNKLPPFREFMQKNSMLAALFPMPDNYGTPQALAGLQTRASVNALINQQLAAGGPNATAQLQQSLQQAQQQLSQLKDKVMKLGGQSGDMEIPDFKANSQRTRGFWQRLKYTTDVQPVRGRGLLPNGMDVGLGLIYKLSDNKQLGAQAVYKAGLGTGLNNIRFSHQGVGYRLYADMKFAGRANIWLSAGYEGHYRAGFKKIIELRNQALWTQNALAGISKKYSMGKKKSGEMKLLYNFLWKQQPNGQQWVWRTGWVF